MILFFTIVMVGTLIDSNSGVAAFTFFFFASGNISSCSVFTLWPRGKLSDCSTKGGLLHRRRRNLKDPRPRCKKPRVAEKKGRAKPATALPEAPTKEGRDRRERGNEGRGGGPTRGEQAGRGTPRDWRVSRHARKRAVSRPPQSNKPAAVLSASHRRRSGGGARNPRPTTATTTTRKQSAEPPQYRA